MAKRRQKASKNKQQQQLFIIGGIVALLIAVAAIALITLTSDSDSDDAPSDTLAVLGNIDESPIGLSANPAALVSPNQYQSTFVGEDLEHVLIDVRTPAEYESGYIDGAGNINVEILEQNLDLIPRDVPIVVYCRSGNRSAQATQILVQNGFTEVYDLGGVLDWEASGLTLIR